MPSNSMVERNVTLELLVFFYANDRFFVGHFCILRLSEKNIGPTQKWGSKKNCGNFFRFESAGNEPVLMPFLCGGKRTEFLDFKKQCYGRVLMYEKDKCLQFAKVFGPKLLE